MEFTKCALIGYDLRPEELEPITGPTLKYKTDIVGEVYITLIAYNLLRNGDYDRYVIAGICKDRTLHNKPAILIDSNFINGDYKSYNPPIDFEEKCIHFLKYLYEFGGKENKEFDLNPTRDFPLAYANSEEFGRIIDQLKNDRLISIRTSHSMGRGMGQYHLGVKLTTLGKEKAKKMLPQLPLFGLVSQEITTGDAEVDTKINHARAMFFDKPASMDKMRSACETLCFVLEPLRNSLSSAFSQKDVSDFFQLVNTFDIRHNKDTTKNLLHEEQLEWVFYTLLNTINTYTKMKSSGKI